jgi:hypothetical protein
MKDYREEAIKDGVAYDVSKHPEIARQKWEEGIGFMRDIFPNTDKEIEGWVNIFNEKDVVFYADLDMTIAKVLAQNIGKYLKAHIEKFKDEILQAKEMIK